jgi:apolipoprotein D and lipocalin family protein
MKHIIRSAVTALLGLAVIGVPAGVATAQSALPQPLRPVSSLDLDRYLGRWFQLAAIPQPFNLICARDTTAEYGLTASGEISVHNSCTTWANTPNSITGSAKVVDPVTKSQLRVSFPGIPNFVQNPDAAGSPNYIVTAIAPDYSWALVGDPLRTSGFLLSRTPALTEPQWRAVRGAIADAGYNGCFLLSSPTTGGRSDISPLC